MDNYTKKLFHLFGEPDGKNRYIKSDDYESDKEWFLDVKIITKSKQDWLDVSSCVFEFNTKQYLAITGDWADSQCPSFLSEFELNVGLFCVMIVDLEIQPLKQSELRVKDEILGVSQDDISGYTGHDFQVIKKYFPRISIFEISKDVPFKQNDVLIYIAHFLLRNPTLLRIKYTEDVIQGFEGVFGINAGTVTTKVIFNGLVSNSEHHCFLELYRCLEALYPIPYLKELSIDLGGGVQGNMTELYNKVNTSLNWSPKGEAAIIKLIKGVDIATLQEVLAVFPGRMPDETKIEETTAQKLYKTRNLLAHLSLRHDHGFLKDIQWVKLIAGVLKILKEVYQKHQECLN